MEYQKLLPGENLLSAIEAYCFFKADEKSTISDFFFPNGKPAIVFHLQNPFMYLDFNEHWEKMLPMSFITCATTPVQLNSKGKTDTVAIVLNPYSIYNMFHVKIPGNPYPIDAGPFIQHELYNQLLVNETIEGRTKILDAYFTEKLKDYNPEGDLFRMICDRIILNMGMVERSSIAINFGVSENYIHKLFMHRIGISFKPYAQIVRVSNILKDVYYCTNPDWFGILEKYGYHDQAHFIKDFKKITGKTPHQYYRLDRTFSAIFSAIA